MIGIIGQEIAEVIWPIVKIGIPVLGVIVVICLGVRQISKSGAAKAERDILEDAEDERIEFEEDRAEERETALVRWRRLRAERAERLRR